MGSAAAPAPAPPPPPQREMLAKNTERLMKIINRILVLLRSGAPTSVELLNLVYALARGIDFAVSAGDVPTIARDVPNILRKVYELRKEPSIRSSVLILAISCKNACSNKWFHPKDSADILKLADELLGNFRTSSGEATNDIPVLVIISKIMPRYYPQLEFKRLVTSMEAKTPHSAGSLRHWVALQVGYDILMADFFIERNLPLEEKIRLVVVQKENLDASSCITSPPHVSFLVNGMGVDMRTNVSMEKGPQFPTDITKMLKYGANIIQAVGYFDADYVIAVAFIKSMTSFSAPKLDDYAQPNTADPADSEVLEGPSRVSLKCPISMTRIKIPVKGYLCKHYQCFDYDNYIKMNLIKPTWRCPHCNTPSNFMELRIDQKINKILQETGDDVLDVLLFADGSWKAAHNVKPDKNTVDCIQQTRDTVQTDSSSRVIDLVNGNGDDLPVGASGFKDTKPLCVLSSQDLSIPDYLSDMPIRGPAQAGQVNSNIVSTSQNVLHPIVRDAVCLLETSNSTSEMVHLHMQLQIGPLHVSERRPTPRNPGSEAVGPQELPVPPQNPGSSRRLQPNTLHCAPPVPSRTSSRFRAHQVTDPGSVIAPVNTDGGTLPRAPTVAPLLHQQSTTLDILDTSSHLPSPAVRLPAPHIVGSPQSAGLPRQTGGANSYISLPVLNELMLQNRVNETSQAARTKTSSAALVRPTQANIQRHASIPQTVPQAASPEAVARVPLHLQSPSEPTAVPSVFQAGASGSTSELPANEIWRPTGRMRGSLTGNAYSHAIERLMGQAAQAGPPCSDGRRPH